MIADWRVGGATLFHAWKPTHDPLNADDITGPCEEFDQAGPAGYADAKVGETFVKMGVGELVKDKGEPYSFMKRYKVANPGKRTYAVADGKHTFTHELTAKSGAGYKLVKTVASKDDATHAVIELRSTLTNTGAKPLTTSVYNHNFFNVNRDAVGANYRFDWGGPLKVTKSEGRYDELKSGDAAGLAFKGKLDAGYVYAEYAGLPGMGLRLHDAPHAERHRRRGHERPAGERVPSLGRLNGHLPRAVYCDRRVSPRPVVQLDDDVPGEGGGQAVTQADWIACKNQAELPNAVRSEVTARQMRLLGCACVRGVWALCEEEPPPAVKLAETYADGSVSKARLRRARQELRAERHGFESADVSKHPRWSALWLAEVVASENAFDSVVENLYQLTAGDLLTPEQIESLKVCDLVRDIVQPYRLAQFDARWRTSTTLAFG